MRVVVLFFVLIAMAVPAAASPWAEVGDRQLREDVERLKAARVITGPINAWPLPWSIMTDVTDAAEDPAFEPELRAAAKRIVKQMELADQDQLTEVNLGFTSRPALIRDFGSVAREKADVSVRVQKQLGPLFVSLGAGYRRNQSGNDLHPEQNYVALNLGNWALYGGYLEHYWGPGNDQALLLSNATRPFPKIGIKRLSAYPINFPVLRWLGPWRLDAFVGELNEKNRDFPNAKFIAARFNFEPTRGLELSLNRTLQLCGKGRPCGARTIGNAVFGFSNSDNTGTFNEPGNQMAGFDVAYTTRIGRVTARFYGEMEAEDEDNIIVDKYARLAGVKLSGPLGRDGASWELGGEWVDTLAWELISGDRLPNVIYSNFIYRYTYRGRSIGASIDGDARLFSINGAVTDTHNRRWYGSLRQVTLNRFSIFTYEYLSANREKINILTTGVQWPTAIGDLKLEGRFMDNAPSTPGRSPARAEVELGWRTRF